MFGIFNWSETEPLKVDRPFEKCDLDPLKKYAAFDFWANRFVGEIGEKLEADLKKTECRILGMREVVDYPVVLSTSRHIAQGLGDIKSEEYDPNKKVLSGESEIVARDNYELRIWLPKNGGFDVKGCSVSSADKDIGVSIEVADKKKDEPGQGVRVVIQSPVTRKVEWEVRF